MPKIMAVYGAAANPPHLGHIDAIEQLLQHADEVRFLPAAGHAFGKRLLPFEHRLQMAKLLVNEAFADSKPVLVDDLEAALIRPGQPVYSIQVLRALQESYPDWQLKLAVGPDNANPAIWSKFRDHDIIDRDFGRLIVEQRLPIRSTVIRERIAAASPREQKELGTWLTGQVGDAVAGYILLNGLYREEQGARADHTSGT